MTQLHIQNLRIQYDNHVVLNQFNAIFEKGLHWIKGHNGSGKSSLLKSICGINPVSEGMIRVNGHDIVRDSHAAKSQLCYVADKPDVYPFMTGLQYLKFIASVKGTELSDNLFAWLEEIHLNEFKHKEFSQMSFGTRRKFALSSVFIGDPQLVLLDEPFNGLDQDSLEKFSDWLKSARMEKCILAVSHEPHIIAEIHDSVTLLGES